MPSSWQERETSGVLCTARIFDRRYSSRSAVPAMKSQVSTSGTTTRLTANNANPQVLGNRDKPISRRRLIADEIPSRRVTGVGYVQDRATACLPCRTTSHSWRRRAYGYRRDRDCPPESGGC